MVGGLAWGGGVATAQAAPDDPTAAALPSVYRVEVTIHVDAFVVDAPGGPRREALAPGRRDFTRTGTAVVVAPSTLATATSLVRPSTAQMMRVVAPQVLASRGVVDNAQGIEDWIARRRPVGASVTAIRVWAAHASGRSPGSAAAVATGGLRPSGQGGVELLDAPTLDRAQPAVLAGPAQTATLVGFGSVTAPLEPRPRTATLAGQEEVTRDLVYRTPALPGDVGAPLVDDAGDVVSLVTGVYDDPQCPDCVRTTRLDDLRTPGLVRSGARGGERHQEVFLTRDALRAASEGDADAARRALAQAERHYPGVTARGGLDEAVERHLADGGARRRRRIVLWSLVAVQLLAAGALAWRALRLGQSPPPPGGSRTHASARTRSR